MKKLLVFALSLLFFASAIGMLQYASSPSSGSAPSSSLTNSVYINGTLSGYEVSSTTLTQQTLTITAPESSSAQPVSLNNPSGTSWTEQGGSGGNTATLSFSPGSYQYYSGSQVEVYGFEFGIAYLSATTYYDIGSVSLELNIGGNHYTQTWSPSTSTETGCHLYKQN